MTRFGRFPWETSTVFLWVLAFLSILLCFLLVYPIEAQSGTPTVPPPTPAPSISLSPRSGPPQTVVTVSGKDSPASALVNINYGGGSVGSANSSPSGSWTFTFSVPPSAQGDHPVSAGSASATFTVTSDVALSTSSAAPGDTVVVTGRGFGASQAGIPILLNDAQVAAGNANSQGSFTASFVVPTIAAGFYTVRVGSLSGQSFSVTSELSLAPATGPVGSTVNLTGSGFNANANVSITFDGAHVRSVTADARGTISASFTVPSRPGGTRIVAAGGSAAGNEAVFILTPSLATDSSSAAPGSSVTVTGEGFAANESNITVTFDGIIVASRITANGQGQWSATFTAPSGAAGSHSIKAYGATTPPASVPTITIGLSASIRLDRSTGAPGSKVKVSGFGYPSNARDITVFAGDAVLTGGVLADGEGRWSADVTIPSLPRGSLTIRASAPSAPSSEATFTVTPVLAVSPESGTPGASITVQGAGFTANQSGIEVTLESASASARANAQGSWSVRLTIPALPKGDYAVRSGGPASELEVPVSVTPIVSVSGGNGSPVTVTGAGFTANERGITVTVDSATLASGLTANGDGSWIARFPAPDLPSGSYNVEASGALTPAPEVQAATLTIGGGIEVTPAKGSPGTVVTVTGSAFGSDEGGIRVTFGPTTVASEVTAAGDGSWKATFVVPNVPAGSYSVTAGGPSTAPSGVTAANFLVGASVTAEPNKGGPGSAITVRGSGFAANERGITITFGPDTVASGVVAAADGTWSATFAAPNISTGSYNVLASGPLTAAGEVEGSAFAIGRSIALTPENGAPGTAITVNGNGFGVNERGITLTYDGETIGPAINADANGEFTAAFVAPASPFGPHKVRASSSVANGGTATETSFAVSPSFTANPTSGSPGATVTIIGSGYRANESGITINFNGAPALQEVKTDAQGSFTAALQVPPAAAGERQIQVAASGPAAGANPGQSFLVKPAVNLNTDTGSIGSTIEVFGSGFAANSPVTIDYGNGLAQSRATTDAAGNFRASFAAPPAARGDHDITAQDNNGNGSQTTFTVESVPPTTPKLLSPASGSGGALFGGYRPTFSWTPSDDPSGAAYTLMIARSPDFDNPLLVEAGLSATSYTLPKQEALPRGEYYWRVKATDGATNESPWSGDFEVKSGIVPIWTLWLAGLALILGASGAGYAFVLRPRLRRDRVQPIVIQDGVTRDISPGLPVPAPAPYRTSELGAAPRLALPAPRRGRALPAEELGRLQRVLDYIRSIPLLQLSSDLEWLESLVTSSGGESLQSALDGAISVHYQPSWMRHPTYAEAQRVLEKQPFLQRLEEYVAAVDWCAGETIELLHSIHDDLTEYLPPGAPPEHLSLLTLAVGQDVLAWFRGTYLREPSARDYVINPAANETDPSNPVSLAAARETPFTGLVVEPLTESAAIEYRNAHIEARSTYRVDESARRLAEKIVEVEVLREQLLRAVNQLDRQR